MKQTVDALDKSAEFTASQLEIPKIENNMKKIASALIMQTLDLDVHRRKWSLTIHGLNGDRGEDDSTTRRKCIALAKNVLGVDDADPRYITACHRLKHSDNSGVIIRFCDLSQRNKWLAGARNLQRHPGKISVSPYLPLVLRSLKNDLLVKWKGLPPADKAKSRINYISRWPYVTLAVAGKPLQKGKSPSTRSCSR